MTGRKFVESDRKAAKKARFRKEIKRFEQREGAKVAYVRKATEKPVRLSNVVHATVLDQKYIVILKPATKRVRERIKKMYEEDANGNV